MYHARQRATALRDDLKELQRGAATVRDLEARDCVKKLQDAEESLDEMERTIQRATKRIQALDQEITQFKQANETKESLKRQLEGTIAFRRLQREVSAHEQDLRALEEELEALGGAESGGLPLDELQESRDTVLQKRAELKGKRKSESYRLPNVCVLCV